MAVSDELRADFRQIKGSIGLTRGILDTAAQKAAEATRQEERRRVMLGLDRSGRRAKGPSASYRKRKASIIAGKKPRKDSIDGKPYRKTRFAATSVQDVGRLSGRTLFERTARAVKGKSKWDGKKIELQYVIGFASPRSHRVAELLRRRGLDMYGPAKPGTKAGREELQAVTDVVTGLINNAVTGRITQRRVQ